jgi:hypothetical protein
MTSKSIPKSVRISQEVQNYVESFEGKSFNDKLNNLILDCKNGKERRQKELLNLDKQIDVKQGKLDKIQNIIETVKREVWWS